MGGKRLNMAVVKWSETGSAQPLQPPAWLCSQLEVDPELEQRVGAAAGPVHGSCIPSAAA